MTWSRLWRSNASQIIIHYVFFLMALKIHIPLREHQLGHGALAFIKQRHFQNQVNGGKINDSKALMNSSNTNWKQSCLVTEIFTSFVIIFNCPNKYTTTEREKEGIDYHTFRNQRIPWIALHHTITLTTNKQINTETPQINMQYKLKNHNPASSIKPLP